MDFEFKNGQQISWPDTEPKPTATLNDFEPRSLAILKKDGTPLYVINNPTDEDVNRLDEVGVVVFRKTATGIKEIDWKE